MRQNPSQPGATRRIGAAVLVAGLLAGNAGSAGGEPPRYRGRRLVEVLGELDRRGLSLVFSSAVVPAELRVPIEPASTEPLAVLSEILAAVGLTARRGPGDSLLILPGTVAAELGGRVVSSDTGRPIPGAALSLAGGQASATSGADGSFVLPVSGIAGDPRLTVSAPGFLPATVAVGHGRPEVDAGTGTGRGGLTVALRPTPTFARTLIVTPGERTVSLDPRGASSRGVTYDEADRAPKLGGDLSRVVELLPGVASPDSSAAFALRGSLPGDVAVVLDGLELYDAFHLTGMQRPFSVIDTGLVERIEVLGGGFTAERGDRHGGFVDLTTREPGPDRTGAVQAGTINSRLALTAAAADGSRSGLLALRAWYPDTLLRTTQLGNAERLEPQLGDLYAKAGLVLAPGHRLSLHGLLVHDRLRYVEKGEQVNERVDAATENLYGWARLTSAWTARLGAETALSVGKVDRRRDGLASAASVLAIEDDREVGFFGLAEDLRIDQGKGFELRTGASLRRLAATYRYRRRSADAAGPVEAIDLAPRGTSLSAYATQQAPLASGLRVEAGLRWDRQAYAGDDQVSPRLNLVWGPAEGTELRLAAGRFHQSERLHELAVEDGETRFHAAERADEIEASFQRGLGSGLGVRVDAYRRHVTHLRPRYENLLDPIDLFPETAADRVQVAPGEARLTGLELQLRGGGGGPLLWWASYALASAVDRVDGEWVPRSWDQTHEGKFLLGYRRRGWSLSLSGAAHSGWPTTPVLAAEGTLADGSPGPVAVAGERNRDRLGAYARLDLKVARGLALGRGHLTLALEVANLTDRQNPCCLDDVFLDPRPDGTVEVRRDFDHWLGITPAASAEWEF